jgi:hypothetical protein
MSTKKRQRKPCRKQEMVPAAILPLPGTPTTAREVTSGEDAEYDTFMEAKPNVFDSNATRYTRSFSMDLALLSPSRSCSCSLHGTLNFHPRLESIPSLECPEHLAG